MITTKPQRDPSTIQLGGKNVVDKSPKRARETEISINFRIANARKRGMQIGVPAPTAVPIRNPSPNPNPNPSLSRRLGRQQEFGAGQSQA